MLCHKGRVKGELKGQTICQKARRYEQGNELSGLYCCHSILYKYVLNNCLFCYVDHLISSAIKIKKLFYFARYSDMSIITFWSSFFCKY